MGDEYVTSNAGGLEVFDADDTEDGPDGSWVEWYADGGEDIDEWAAERK